MKAYLDSLYRGYPTGSFLIWRTPNPGRIRGAQNDTGAVFQLILDGQQRLTSIYTLVNGEPPPFYEGETLYFNLYFNVRTEEFQYYQKRLMQGQVEWLPVTQFLKLGLGEYLGPNGPCSDDDRAFLWQFLPRLTALEKVRSYSYYLDTLGELEMDQVVKIFNLVNKQGTPLTKTDLAMSHICALWPDARQIMRDAQEEHAKAGFDFDLNFYVRMTSAVATESGVYEPLYRLHVDVVQSAWKRAKRALDYLLNVLRDHAYIDSTRTLSSDFVLVPLVVYLANGDGIFRNERERNDFLHWMFAALMWGRYTGSTETKLNQDIQMLKLPDAASRMRDAIISERGRIRLEGRDLVGASSRSPFSALALVAARAAGAVDWLNGQKLYSNIGKSNSLEYHHIFPQSLLYAPKGPFNSSDRSDVARVNEIANIAYLTQSANQAISNKEPIQYLASIEQTFPGALAAQAVPESPALWRMEAYQDFLAVRRERLAESINRFMDSLLPGAPPTHFTVEDYIAQGEGDTVEFKMSLRWDYKTGAMNKALEKVVARTLAAFMNAKGGTLVIGVSDDGKIVGIEQDFATLGSKNVDGWEVQLRNVLNGYLGKDVCALVEASFPTAEGKTIAVLHTERQAKPVFLNDGGATEFHVRVGNTTQLLDVKQANSYIAQHFPATYS